MYLAVPKAQGADQSRAPLLALAHHGKGGFGHCLNKLNLLTCYTWLQMWVSVLFLEEGKTPWIRQSIDKRAQIKEQKMKDTLPWRIKFAHAFSYYLSFIRRLLINTYRVHICVHNDRGVKQKAGAEKQKPVRENKRQPPPPQKKPSRHPQEAPIVINENKYWERVKHRHRETAQTMEQTV